MFDQVVPLCGFLVTWDPLQMGEGLTGIRVGQFIAMADKTIAVQPPDATSLNTFPVQSFCDADSF